MIAFVEDRPRSRSQESDGCFRVLLGGLDESSVREAAQVLGERPTDAFIWFVMRHWNTLVLMAMKELTPVCPSLKGWWKLRSMFDAWAIVARAAFFFDPRGKLLIRGIGVLDWDEIDRFSTPRLRLEEFADPRKPMWERRLGRAVLVHRGRGTGIVVPMNPSRRMIDGLPPWGRKFGIAPGSDDGIE